MKFRVAIGFGVGLLGALACGDTTPGSGGAQYGHASSASGPLQVWVVNHPLEYLASRVGGDSIDVVFPAPPDVDPASWSPDPEVILGYQRADLIALNGAGYARWVDRVTLPQSKRVDTSASFRDRLLPIDSEVTHSHGPTGEHSHGDLAATLWLDPKLATEQARALQEAFTGARPEQGETFRDNQLAVARDLAALDARLEHATGLLGDRPIVYSHPVYQYLQSRFRLNGRAVHWEPDEAPDEAMWRELEEILARHPARLMLWEAKPLDEVASRLESYGVESVVFDPAGHRSREGDWLTVMTANAERLEAAVD